ncbi:MAG: glycosyltransferase [Bacteroidota bacterium]|nr:glycosyltransferase [Bacteroidota bacterium]
MGSAKRNFPFFRENLKRHDVWVLSFGSEEDEIFFRQHYGDLCKYIRFVNFRKPRIINIIRRLYLFIRGESPFRLNYGKKFQDAIDEIIMKEKFDIIHCCYPMFGFYKYPAGTPLVSDTHNIEYDLVYQRYKNDKCILLKIYYYFAYRTGKHEEIENLKKFNVIITTTKNDYKGFRKDVHEKPMYIIQNGVDKIFFEQPGVQPEPKTMIFLGLMNYYPNDHAIHNFLDNTFPLIISKEPESRLFIVGANPSKSLRKRASEKIIITGYVDDVRPYIARAEVFIIPLLIGSGIRGKALEAMAMKRPIVSTTIGCSGIFLKHEESALFADTSEDFARAVVQMFNDRELRSRITEKAFSIVQEQYDWTKKGEELHRIYCTIQLSKNQ